MITCLYCRQECPDGAQICPKCGKSLILLPPDDTPDYAELAKSRRQETEPKEPLPEKRLITFACAALLLALVAYTIFSK